MRHSQGIKSLLQTTLKSQAFLHNMDCSTKAATQNARGLFRTQKGKIFRGAYHSHLLEDLSRLIHFPFALFDLRVPLRQPCSLYLNIDLQAQSLHDIMDSNDVIQTSYLVILGCFKPLQMVDIKSEPWNNATGEGRHRTLPSVTVCSVFMSSTLVSLSGVWSI